MNGFEALTYMDATALAGLVRQKEVTPLELVDFFIDRIERINPRLNAVVTPMFDEARSIAQGPIPDGPFKGVPMLLKDLLAAYRGVRHTFGTKNLAQFIADHDSEIVRRYKQAGFIVLGKTNLPELGLLPTTESALFGPCRNPWDLTRTTGGSSGGSAAAVAAGLIPVAHGNDGGGSIRIPASCCGVFGLKPSRGRNTLGPDFGDIMSGLVAEHVLTRSVRDSAAILDVTSGYDPGDPYVAPPPTRPFREEIGRDPGRLRIAYLTSTMREGINIHPDCQAALEAGIKLLESLGHELEEINPKLPAELIARAFTTIWVAGCAATIKGIAFITKQPPARDQYEPLTWAMYEMGQKVSGADYLLAVQTLQRMTRDLAKLYAQYDVLLTPTLGEPPVKLGAFDSPPDDPLRGWRRSAEFVPFTPIFNATGQPAMSVPLYWNGEGLPIGLHFVGRYGEEGLLFRLAAQLEQAQPWTNRRPPAAD
ncbi:MAG TPA: amidase [Syntrophales bacterium]|nr:amidase [Syntrophales bacterium]HOL58634.1 amidase [Syntrophales bacterium]HPO35078.1 amidase [Syntrophales bacterium]